MKIALKDAYLNYLTIPVAKEHNCQLAILSSIVRRMNTIPVPPIWTRLSHPADVVPGVHGGVSIMMNNALPPVRI